MGRPPRQQDDDLLRAVRSLIDTTGSSRRVALALGIEPSTLTRSLKAKAFAEGTAQKIRQSLPNLQSAWLDQGKEKSLERMVHIMQELSGLLPTAIAALQAAERRFESPGPDVTEQRA